MRILKLNFLSLILLSVMALGVSSCKNEKKPEVQNEQLVEAQSIYERSIEIHDEVMPKMNDLRTLTKKLEALKDSVEVASTDKPAIVEKIDGAIANLKTANDAMQDWMANVKQVPSPDEDFSDAVSVQKAQKNEVEKVQDQTETSIKQAEDLLANVKP